MDDKPRIVCGMSTIVMDCSDDPRAVPGYLVPKSTGNMLLRFSVVAQLGTSDVSAAVASRAAPRCEARWSQRLCRQRWPMCPGTRRVQDNPRGRADSRVYQPGPPAASHGRATFTARSGHRVPMTEAPRRRRRPPATKQVQRPTRRLSFLEDAAGTWSSVPSLSGVPPRMSMRSYRLRLTGKQGTAASCGGERIRTINATFAGAAGVGAVRPPP